MKTKVTGAFVIGFDGTDHVIYPNGEVVYEGNQIIFVGHHYPQGQTRFIVRLPVQTASPDEAAGQNQLALSQQGAQA